MFRRAPIPYQHIRLGLPIHYEAVWLSRSRYCFSELPKGSNFSQFMGLNKDLEQFRKQQIKKQSSQVRNHSMVVIGALTLFGTFVFLLIFDKNINFWMTKKHLNLKLNLFRAKTQKIKVLDNSLAIVDDYLTQNPYQYLRTLDILLVALKQIQLLADKQLLTRCGDCYLKILNKNFKAAQNREFIEGIRRITELCLVLNHQVSQNLVQILLIHGSIKQIYLGVKYFRKVVGGTQRIQRNKMLLQILVNNIGIRLKEDKQYYSNISQERLEGDYPQIDFKYKQELKWVKIIQKELKLQIV